MAQSARRQALFLLSLQKTPEKNCLHSSCPVFLKPLLLRPFSPRLPWEPFSRRSGGGGGSSGRWHRSSCHFVLKALSWTQDASCLTCSHHRPPLCSASQWFLLKSLASKMAGVSLPSAFRHPLGDLCQRWGCKYRVCVDHAYAPVSDCLVLSPFGCLKCHYIRVSKTEVLNFSTSLSLALQRTTKTCCSVFQC